MMRALQKFIGIFGAGSIFVVTILMVLAQLIIYAGIAVVILWLVFQLLFGGVPPV